MKNILVTGSAGFIGYHLSKKLLTGKNSVIGIDNFYPYYDTKLKAARNGILLENKNYHFYSGDINDSLLLNKIFRKHEINSICHLAAQPGVRYSLKNPIIYADINLKGFINVLEIARKYKTKTVVYASSSSVYGNNKFPAKGFTETDRVDQPISLYGATKRADELMAYTYHHLFGIHCTGLRLFTVYGPWGRPDMAIYKFTKAIISNQPISLYNFGKMKRDFTYIDDAVEGFIAALDKSYAFEIFNIGNSRLIGLLELISCIEKNLHKNAKINLLPLQKGDLTNTYANIKYAKKKLHYVPSVRLKTGIKLFIEWFEDYHRFKK